MKALLLGIFLLAPSLSFAAYQNPVITANTATPDGGGRITLQFAGNAGEPIVTKSYVVQQGSTFQNFREWVDDTIVELNRLFAAKTLPGLQPGQTVTRLARVNPPPTAKQIWKEKHERYIHYKNSGITSTDFTTDLNNLKADLDATYQGGFID